MKNKALAALCLLVVAGILSAGLWPFNPFPKNEVNWLPDRQGLHFGDYATVLSSGSFRPPQPDGPCALEVWLIPGLTDDSNTILAFSTPEDPEGFRVGQNRTTLYLARTFHVGASSQLQTNWIAVHDVFQQDKPVFVSVTADPAGTAVYIDGNKARVDPRFGLSARDLTGTMVVANSPVANNSWSGLMKGIALYYSALSEQQVSEHYHSWTEGDATSPASQNADALYLFRERGDRIANMGSGKQPDLMIPKSYTVIHPAFLLPFWKTFEFTRSYGLDVFNNVVAFIPLGFLISAYLSETRFRNHSFRNAVLFGFLVSLTIEVLQYFIPMRDSGTMDLFTNTSGTAIGAWLYVLEARHSWLGKLPLAGRIWRALYPAKSAVTASVGS